jgi:hypothetical protein
MKRNKHLKGEYIMSEEWPGGDTLGILEDCRTQREIDYALDDWDAYYGKYPNSYEVYVLLDSTKPGIYKFGTLEFDYEPFYVGHGQIGRSKKSASLWGQIDIYSFKTKRMKEIAKKRGSIRYYKIGYFQTKTKAFMVEKKLMNLIPRSYLTNSLLHLCEVPIIPKDYEILTMRNNLKC